MCMKQYRMFGQWSAGAKFCPVNRLFCALILGFAAMIVTHSVNAQRISVEVTNIQFYCYTCAFPYNGATVTHGGQTLTLPTSQRTAVLEFNQKPTIRTLVVRPNYGSFESCNGDDCGSIAGILFGVEINYDDVNACKRQSFSIGGSGNRLTFDVTWSYIDISVGAGFSTTFCEDATVNFFAALDRDLAWEYSINLGGFKPFYNGQSGQSASVTFADIVGPDYREYLGEVIRIRARFGDCIFNAGPNYRFLPAGPTIDPMASYTEPPTCPGGTDGSIALVHPSIISGTSYTYSIVQWAQVNSDGTCPSSPVTPPGAVIVPSGYCAVNIANAINADGASEFRLNSSSVGEQMGFAPGKYTVYVEVTRESGSAAPPNCYSLYEFDIPPPAPPAVGVTSISPPLCEGAIDGSIALTLETRGPYDAQSDVMYSLRSSEDTYIRQNVRANLEDATRLTIGGVGQGTYTVEIKDFCHDAVIEAKDVAVGNGPALVLDTETIQPLCVDVTGASDGGIEVSVSPVIDGLTYRYRLYSSGGDLVESSGYTGDTHTFSALEAPLTYYVDLETNNGCSARSDVEQVNLPESLEDALSAVVRTQPECSNSTDGVIAVAVPSRPRLDYTLKWNKVDGPDPEGERRTSDPSEQLVEGLSQGDYVVTLIDHCRSDQQIVLPDNLKIENPAPISIPSISDISVMCYEGTATAFVGVDSPTPSYSIDVRKGGLSLEGYPRQVSSSTLELSSLAVDNSLAYEITVTEECPEEVANVSFQSEFWVTSPASTPITTSIQRVAVQDDFHLRCADALDGEVVVRIDGGVQGSPLHYRLQLLDGGGNVLTDNNGAQPDPDGTIRGGIDTGSGIEYVLSNLRAGIHYQLKVTDFSGTPACEKIFDIGSLNAPPALILDAPDFNNDFVNGVVYGGDLYLKCRDANDLSFTPDVTGGVPPYNISLYSGTSATDFASIPLFTVDGSGSFDGLGAGWYRVEVADANGCTATSHTFEIKEATEPLALVGLDAARNPTHNLHVTCHDSADGRVTATVAGGLGPYSYFLDGGDIHREVLNNPAASHEFSPGVPALSSIGETIAYTITVRDALGCLAVPDVGESSTIALEAPDPVTFNVTVVSPVRDDYEILCKGDEATLHVTSVGGWFSHQFVVDGTPVEASGSENTFADFTITAGDYTVTVRDAVGCEAEPQTLQIDEPAEPVDFDIVSVIPPACIGGVDGAITISGRGGVPDTVEPYRFEIRTKEASDFDSEVLIGTEVTFLRPASDFVAQAYVVRIMDSHGCSREAEVSMPPNPNPLRLALDEVVPPSCHGAANGSVQVTASDYVGTNLIFHISGGHLGDDVQSFASTNAVFTFNDLEGTDIDGRSPYQIWVEDDNHCAMLAYQYLPNVALTSPSPVNIAHATGSPTRPSCYNGTDGSIAVTISGGEGPYTYSLNDADYLAIAHDGELFIPNLTMGDYTLYVRDAQYDPNQPACLSQQSFTVLPGRMINLSADIDRVVCKGGADGAIDLSVEVVNHNLGEVFDPDLLALSWTYENMGIAVGTDEDLSNLAAGVYAVRASYDGCVAERSFVVPEPVSALQIADVAVYSASCGSTNSGRAVLSLAGGWPETPVYYRVNSGTWALASGFSVVLSGLAPDSYTVEVSQGSTFSCVSSSTFVINRAALPLEVVYVQPPSCPGANDGAIVVSSMESHPMFSINGGPFQNDGMFTGLAAGQYLINAIRHDDAVCQSEVLEVEVIDPADCGEGPLTAYVTTVLPATCAAVFDGEARIAALGGVPPYRYFWGGTEGTAAGAHLAAGSHNVTVEDAMGTRVELSIAVPVAPPLTAEGFLTLASCANTCDGGAAIVVDGGSGDFVVEWADGFVGDVRTDLCVGIHEYQVRDLHNSVCVLPGSVTIESYPQVSVAAVTEPPTCAGGDDGSARLSITGGSGEYDVLWATGESSLSRTNLTPGAYSVTVTDRVLECAVVESVMVDDATPIEVLSVAATEPRCFGGSDGSVTLTLDNVTNPLVQWDNGQTGLHAANLSAGRYSYTITGADGCRMTSEVTVEDRPALVTTATIKKPSCAGYCDGGASIVVDGGVAPYFVEWSHGLRGPLASNLCAAAYTYTVTDRNSCQITGTMTLDAPNPIALDVEAMDPSCYGDTDGTITLTAAGGTGTYTYMWRDTDLSASTRTNLGRGAYTAIVYDENGCSARQTVTLQQPSLLHLGQDVITPPSCYGLADGSIRVVPSGGSGSYSFLWENSDTQSLRENLEPGTYEIQVTDTQGCEVRKTYNLVSPQALQLVNVELRDPWCFGNADGSISVEVTGGVAPYAYAWQGGPSTQRYERLKAGAYTLAVTDVNGCVIGDVYTLTDPPKPVLAGISDELVICANGRTAVRPEGEWLSYLWTGPAGFSSTASEVEVSLEGQYTLLTHDARNCPATKDFSVVVSPSALVADFLRISEAVAYEPIVFVDISVPVPDDLRWIIPDDKDVVVNRQTGEMIEITFHRPDAFEIGIEVQGNNCTSTLYKIITIADPADTKEEGDSGGRLGGETITLTVYPNPVTETMYLELEVPTRDAIDLRLISGADSKLAGRRLLSGQLDYVITWELPDAKSGVYYLLYEYKGTLYSRRIVIVR